MVFLTPETIFRYMASAIVCCQVIDATIFEGRAKEEAHVAEERIFKGKKLSPLLDKKKRILSHLIRTGEPQVVHTLSPIEHYPIWKVHKYKGIELRPVQVVDVPSPFDYSPVQPNYYQLATEPVRTPHTEYGVPVVNYNSISFGGTVNPEETTKIVGGSDVEAPAPIYHGFHHGGKLRALLGFLTKLRNLKTWKLGLNREPAHYGVPLPEVHEIPVKGLENLNLQVPELPGIGLPTYSTAVTGGPYVKVQVASPIPVVNYASPQYAPQYEYQYPPQYTPDYSLSNHYAPPTQDYGAPQLYNSYGMPLPADAYSTASSDHILSFAVPENVPVTEQQNQLESGEFNVGNGTLTDTVENLPGAKFLTEDKEKNEEATKVMDTNDQQQIQTSL